MAARIFLGVEPAYLNNGPKHGGTIWASSTVNRASERTAFIPQAAESSVGMCGRTSLFPPRATVEERFDATLVAEYEPRYNIAPGSDLHVIPAEDPTEIRTAMWGLMPGWADSQESGIINARAETVDEKPAFREAWKERPCLVLSSGFYEWQSANGGPKQPYRIRRRGDPAFAMAGILETTDTETSVAILTTDPNETVAPIHDRMPVVLPEGAEQTYLRGAARERMDLCQPYPCDDLEATPISTAVNDPSVDSPDLIEPIDRTQSDLDEFA